MGAMKWESQINTKKYVYKAPKIQHTYSCSIPQAAVVQHSTDAKEILNFQQTEMKYFASGNGKNNIILFKLSS